MKNIVLIICCLVTLAAKAQQYTQKAKGPQLDSLNNKLIEFRKNKAWDSVICYEIKKINLTGLDTAGLGKTMINNMVFSVIFKYANKKEQLEKALSYMDVILQSDPECDPWLDTYANLLYKLGRKKEALSFQRKAIAIAKRKADDAALAEYGLAFSKMLNDQPTWTD